MDFPDGAVKHVQCCTGCAPHVTVFSYLSQANLKDIFAVDYDLVIHERGRTLLCVATKSAE